MANFRLETDTYTYRILLYIQDHPGCSRAEIMAGISPSPAPASTTGILQYLKHSGVIENRGNGTRYKRWYAVENDDDINPTFRRLADHILDEMAQMHPSLRRDYLARQLEEIS